MRSVKVVCGVSGLHLLFGLYSAGKRGILAPGRKVHESVLHWDIVPVRRVSIEAETNALSKSSIMRCLCVATPSTLTGQVPIFSSAKLINSLVDPTVRAIST